MRYFGAYILSIVLKVVGLLSVVVGGFGLFFGLTLVGKKSDPSLPAVATFLDAYLANVVWIGSFGFIGSGLSLLVFGYLIAMLIQIERNTRETMEHSQETTAFFQRVAGRSST